MTKTLTRDEAYELQQRIMDAEDTILDDESGSKRALYNRLLEAEKQLEFLIRHTTTDGAVLLLPDAVAVACFDAYIEI